MTLGVGFQLYSARFPALFAFQNSFEMGKSALPYAFFLAISHAEPAPGFFYSTRIHVDLSKFGENICL